MLVVFNEMLKTGENNRLYAKKTPSVPFWDVEEMDIDTDVEISSKQLETCICYAEERLLLETYIWGVISFASKFKLWI